MNTNQEQDGYEPLVPTKNITTGNLNSAAQNNTPPVINNEDGWEPLVKSSNSPEVLPSQNKESIPGADSALLPAQPADGSARLGDIAKVVPNSLGDIWNLVKQGTVGTVQNLAKIPGETINLVKEQGIGNAIKNTLTSIPGAVKDTALSLVPQSAKEILNTNALSEIPAEFKSLVEQNGGSYANALLSAVKSVPGAIPDAVSQYANQIDRARQAVENHPVNEFLGYLGLKALGENKVNIPQDSILNKPVSEIPKDTLNALPGSETIPKMVRRVGDTFENRKELNQQPEAVQKAVKSDIPQPQAELIHEANPQEKAVMKQMLDLQEKGTKKLIMKPEERPDAKIGQQAMNMVNFLQDQKKQAQIVEGEHVKGLTNRQVDFSKTAQDFKDRLATLGVTEGEKGRLDFSKSELSTPSSAKDRGLLQLTSDELKPNENGQYIKPANELHTIRQRLFNETQNKNFTEPFTDRIVSMVHNDEGTSVRSGLLHDISKQAGSAGKGYEAETTRNAKIQNALQTFFKLVGKDSGGREMNIKNLGAGEVANRLEGNASAKVENAFKVLEDTAKEYGFKSNVSIRKLVAFKTILKNVVGETQHNSLAGGVEQGTKAALPDALDIASHAVEGNKMGVIKSVGKFIKGNTRAEQIRNLKNLLNSTYETPRPNTTITKTVPELIGIKPESIDKIKTFIGLGKKAAEKAGLGEDYQKVMDHISNKNNIDPDLGF